MNGPERKPRSREIDIRSITCQAEQFLQSKGFHPRCLGLTAAIRPFVHLGEGQYLALHRHFRVEGAMIWYEVNDKTAYFMIEPFLS